MTESLEEAALPIEDTSQARVLPVIALVGRPNVGKSTLFNVLTNTRNALVGDRPGLTRDRQYGHGRYGSHSFIVVDTGGIIEKDQDKLAHLLAKQSQQAILESDIVFFLVDAREGLLPDDQAIAKQLRKLGKKIYLVVNKVDTVKEHLPMEFYQLGLGEPWPMAAAHRRGISALLGQAFSQLPEEVSQREAPPVESSGIKVAIIGRPNVGKSTLVNRLLGEDRVIVFDMPGTTRDSIFIPLERQKQRFTLIDTAGVRRRSRVDDHIEKFSVVKTLQAIEAADVVIVVFDATEAITDQDLHILGFALDAGRSLVLAINKWDGMEPDARARIRDQLDLKLRFVDYAEQLFISALHGSGTGLLWKAIIAAYRSAHKKVSTSRVTQLLQQAVAEYQPPLSKGRRIKLRYAHFGGHNPPTIVIHGTQAEVLPHSYQRYLASFYREKLRLVGTPIRIELKNSDNPFHQLDRKK